MLLEGPGTCVHRTPSLGGRVTFKVEERAQVGLRLSRPAEGSCLWTKARQKPGEKNDRTRWRSRLKCQAMF